MHNLFAQHSADESTFVYASANISTCTKNSHSSQTAQLASDTLKVAPMNEADEFFDPDVSPQTDENQSTLPPLLTPLCNGSQNMSMRGWSGALPNATQLFPTLEDVRRAICQVRCPESNKEKIDDHPLFVSPCVLSTPVYLMQERDNKVMQKSASLILGCRV